MNVIKMNIDDIKSPERNVRIHSKKQIEEFKRSVSMFGQIRPIVIDETNTILCGNGLYETLHQLDYKTVDVYKIEGLSENRKKKLMLADNKIYSLGIDDIDVFDQFIEELSGDLDIPGYDEDILQSMIADAAEVTKQISEYGTIDQDTIRHIQNNQEVKESQISSPLNNGSHEDAQTPKADFERITEDIPPKSSESSTDDSSRFIICPKCGCKIWL